MPLPNNQSTPRSGLPFFGLLIGLSLIISALIGAWALSSIKDQGRTIRVTGAAYKPIRSDLANWRADISAAAPTLEEGYAELDRSITRLKNFLTTKGYAETDYSLSAISIRKEYNRDRQLTGYNLFRTVRLEENNVDRVTDLASEASTMIKDGIMIQSRPVEYLFTRLDSLKLEMIEAATENAQERARRLAGTTGHEVGAPIYARVGVFQIRPLRSQDVSSSGISDLSSIDKEIVSTVHIDFLID